MQCVHPLFSNSNIQSVTITNSIVYLGKRKKLNFSQFSRLTNPGGKSKNQNDPFYSRPFNKIQYFDKHAHLRMVYLGKCDYVV